MFEFPSLRTESHYGLPSADLLLYNRAYVVGYSFLYRMPRWAAEVIDPENSRVEIDERTDTFRTDPRIPTRFRAELDDYRGSGLDRGHLIASADRRTSMLLNSETFLLSNMSPQRPEFNRQIWRDLEMQVRDLATLFEEVYAVCGPLYDIGKTVDVLPNSHVPIPHSFFKSVLAEPTSGKLRIWSFILPNEQAPAGAKTRDFLVSTEEVEIRAGLALWSRIEDPAFLRKKASTGRMWSLSKARESRRRFEDELADRRIREFVGGP